MDSTAGSALLLQPLVNGLAGDAELAGDGGLVSAVAGHGFLEALAHHDGNKSAAARELGVTRKTIHKWLSQE